MNTTTPTLEDIEKVEVAMLKMPQVDCPVTNLFAPGIYWREVEIPAGTIALGHRHKTEHLNVLLSGRVRVLCDGHVKELVAPQVFSSPAGVRKLVYAVERTRWANVHANPADETDMAKLEVIFIEKSASFLAHQNEILKLLNHSDQDCTCMQTEILNHKEERIE
jgi:quercetin dioxygenase-like cupin family protein